MNNVIAAYPFGDRATVVVHVKKDDSLTKKAVEKMFQKQKSLTVTGFKKESHANARGN